MNNTDNLPFQDIAQAIDEVTYPSQGIYTVFLQIRRMISKLAFTQSLANGNETSANNLTTFNLNNVLLRGSYNQSLNTGQIQFPSSVTYLNNTDNYFSLSVIQWKFPVFTWVSDYSKLRTNTIYSIDLMPITQDNTIYSYNFSSPINITFPLDVSRMSWKDINSLRCSSWIIIQDNSVLKE